MNNAIPLKRSEKFILKLQNIRLFPACLCYNCGRKGFKVNMIKGVDSFGVFKPIYACDEVCKMAIVLQQRRESEERWRRFIYGIGSGLGV